MNTKFIGKILLLSFSYLLFLNSCTTEKNTTEKSPNRPNILLIVADDLGFTDLGCYGSEIKTPNIDALAQQSTRFTSFCTGPTCSPTRGMLLSGVDAHRNGYGTMDGDWADNQLGLRGYEGYLNFDVVTFPKLLQDAKDETKSVHPTNKVHAWELYGRRGLKKGQWKIEWMEAPYGNSEWELYDLSTDISQQNNLAKTHPEKLAELLKDWTIYEKENNVTLPDRPTAYAKEAIWRE